VDHVHTDLLSPTLARVAARARRRALRAGDRTADTGHLLHALLESEESALAALAPLPAQRTRLLGYLAQRSIGFGRGWHGSAEEEQQALLALERTALRALLRRQADPAAEALDLLGELAARKGSRAAQILRGAGVEWLTGNGATPSAAP
jgi:ATP-dependent Clp protease ATP-binding subunit ClpA